MRRSLVSLLVGVVLAILSIFMVNGFQNKNDNLPTSPDGKSMRIVVAARDLPFGSNIIIDHLTYADWPISSLPQGAFTDIAALVDDKDKKGSRVVLRALYKGEPLLQQHVSGFGDKSTLSRKVGEDKRAFSVRVNDVSGVAGFLLPGDHVDVMLTRRAAGKTELMTDVILQNVVILGIDQLTDEGSEKPKLARTVTMEVTADQAQKLALAQQSGTLSLTLRNYTDNDEIATGRVSVSDLVGRKGSASADMDGGVIRIRRGLSLDYAATE